MTWANLIRLSLGFLWAFSACGPGATEATESDQAKEPQPMPVASNFIPPAKLIALNMEPTPFPYGASGLRFQDEGLQPDQSNNPFKPIGDASLATDGSIAISFPDIDLLALFKAPRYKMTLLGNPALGGAGEVIERPARLWLSSDGLFFCREGSRLLFQIDHAGQTSGIFQASGADPYPGPNGEHLARDQDRPYLYHRYASTGQSIAKFRLPQTEEEMKGGGGVIWAIGPQWTVAAVRRDGGMITRFSPNGKLTGFFLTDKPVQALDLAITEQFLWLLVRLPDLGFPLLIAVDEAGNTPHIWQAPMLADAMDIVDDQFLFINRQKGSAVRYTP